MRLCVRVHWGAFDGLCATVSMFLIQPTIDHLLFPSMPEHSIFSAGGDIYTYAHFQQHTHTHTRAHALKSHHLKEVYTRDRSIKGPFEAQSKATSQRAVRQRSVRSQACHLASPYRSGAPHACFCFPNHSHTGNQAPAFRGKHTLGLFLGGFFLSFFSVTTKSFAPPHRISKRSCPE